MATKGKNLSEIHRPGLPAAKSMKVGIACAEWNEEITGNLLAGAIITLEEAGVLRKNITIIHTPGAFELPLACQWLLQKNNIMGVIAIGSVIQGETRHFDFVCQGVTQGIMEVGLKYNKPAIFCVLTDHTLEQAMERSGGNHGNKGVECAMALIKMLNNSLSLKK
ncbi:MAG TPA: 6,7-dimethyl-8-ribityllumazine synthase [Flavobacteriales bacterium]|nr:6,7-dimethyl-8-ribityllumazine synthase [Flavobacteriales bacterium]